VTFSVAICDDMSAFRSMLAIALALEPALEVVGAATNAAEAVELTRLREPDVLLLDVAMPQMDGIEALSHLRKLGVRTRVVMLSGFGDPDIKARALAAGAFSYLEKGATPAEIAEAVLAACASRQ
jgi:two-component system, NarL family, response regulator DesR